MNIILLGPPGSGKGTQASILSSKLGIPHISTGDIFRNKKRSNDPLGKKIKKIIDAGHLVPDDLTVEIVIERLSEKDCEHGFVLDGFPRTIFQGEALEKFLENKGQKVDVTISINVPDEIVVERIQKRILCSACGISYNKLLHPPIISGKCDECGSKLVIRDDDDEKTIKERLEVYRLLTEPLVGYYKEKNMLCPIDGDKEVDIISSEVLSCIGD